ncbi:hypothetical protein C2S51_000509 [Perilla frutescens var. frutescens]|nr:hypothetical protein C2S51_000509 [Perilla frutescens var. frutescens]
MDNGYDYWAGLSTFHSGLKPEGSDHAAAVSLLNKFSSNLASHSTVLGVEYAFGARDSPTGGVFKVEPRRRPGFQFMKTIRDRTTWLDATQVRDFMERHFFILFLSGNVGSMFNCLLPETVKSN